MDIKLVVTDLDRTLLRTDKNISDYTVSIFKQCRERGIVTAIATARSEVSAKRYIDRINPDIVISCGGALVRCSDKTIYRSVLPASISDRLIYEMVTSDLVGEITVDCDSGYYVSYSSPADHPDYLHGIYYDFNKPLGQDTYKITSEIFDQSYAKQLLQKYPECSVIHFSGEAWCRFASVTADKSIALQKLSSYLDVPTSQFAAFGDDYNDIEMIRGCGIGVAVANAIDEAKAVADFICDTNDNDGVAGWLDERVLPGGAC